MFPVLFCRNCRKFLFLSFSHPFSVCTCIPVVHQPLCILVYFPSLFVSSPVSLLVVGLLTRLLFIPRPPTAFRSSFLLGFSLTCLFCFLLFIAYIFTLGSQLSFSSLTCLPLCLHLDPHIILPNPDSGSTEWSYYKILTSHERPSQSHRWEKPLIYRPWGFVVRMCLQIKQIVSPHTTQSVVLGEHRC